MLRNLTYLVSAPPVNMDVIRFHSILLKKYWSDCPYSSVLVVNDEPKDSNFYTSLRYDTVIYSGAQTDYISRLKYALNQIETPYIMLSIEDFFLYAPVNTKRIIKLFDLMQKYNAAFFSLSSLYMKNYPYIDNVERIKEIPKNTAYRYNFQAAIWEKEFLLSLLTDYKNIWDFERGVSFSKKGSAALAIGTDYTGYPYIEAVTRGKWRNEALHLLANENLYPDLQKRKKLSDWELFKLSFKGLIFNANSNLITKLINFSNLGYKGK